MPRLVVITLLAAGCTAPARAPVSQGLASTPAPHRPVPRPQHLVEHEMPDLVELPLLLHRAAAAPPGDPVMRGCFEWVKAAHGSYALSVLREAANTAIAIGGDCRLAADQTLGERALR